MTKQDYDLLNEADYKAFAAKYGDSAARTIRFGLAYGFNRKGLQRGCAGPKIDISAVDFAALEAAYGQGDKR